jgi:hypothetical protein
MQHLFDRQHEHLARTGFLDFFQLPPAHFAGAQRLQHQLIRLAGNRQQRRLRPTGQQAGDAIQRVREVCSKAGATRAPGSRRPAA